MRYFGLFVAVLLFVSGVCLASDRKLDVHHLSCQSGYAAFASPGVSEELAPRIEISTEQFDEITNRLRDTLSGNLATVLRSEWKAKGTTAEANRYVSDLTDSFLSQETREIVTQGLNVENEEYTRTIARRLFDLGEQKKLKKEDLLVVRDPAPPTAARDFTFTYYTRAVSDSAEGKHQMRVRNYLRTVDFRKLEIDFPVNTFNGTGESLSIRRLAENKVEFVLGQGPKAVRNVMGLDEAIRKHGPTFTAFAAPHGGKFKLEVKSRLKDEISAEKFPLLGGRNIVQKPDVSLSAQQVSALFAVLPEDASVARLVATSRVKALEDELIATIEAKANKVLSSPTTGEAEKLVARKERDHSVSRAKAVMHMLKVAVGEDPNFLKIEGATLYSRTAFEISVPDTIAGASVKLQTTIDRDLGVFGQVYADDGAFLSPIDTFQKSEILKPASAAEQRHWELKVPRPLVAKEIGLKPTESMPFAPDIEVDDVPSSAELKKSLELFSFCQVTNRGKFMHICKQLPVDDRKAVR